MSALSNLLAARKEKNEEKVEWESRNIFPTPNSYLFIAIYTPFLKHPSSFQTMEFREYKNWLLGDACYVLNTFNPMNTTGLRGIYLENHERYIQTSSDFHRIAEFLWDLELTVPDSFRETFEWIAEEWIAEDSI